MGVRRRGGQRQQKHAAKTGQDAVATVVATESTPKAQRWNSQNETRSLAPGFKKVFAAIVSLYADGLKPFGRILRKRVAELATERNEENAREVDIKHLRTTCEEAASLRVEPEEGGDWSVYIVGRPETFIDVYSSVDVYPEGMWGAAAAYFQLLSGDDMKLPGGRYSCAQMLQSRGLAFLHGRSLGAVCHIVQLAISQRKLLGYLNGAVVPYAFSQSMLKEQCALLKAPCAVMSEVPGGAVSAAVAENSLAMASWETARQYLRDILGSAAEARPGEVGMVPLSNIKRLFRSRFHTELSETRLGHSKLSELLQDERFSDICNVQLQGNGYIVFQVPPQESQPILVDGGHPVRGGDVLDSEPSRIDVGSLVQRTFIHASPPPLTPPPNARRRSASLPKDVGSDKGLWEAECHTLGFMPVCGDQAEDTASTIDSSTGSAVDGSEPSQGYTSCQSLRPSPDDPVKVILRECSLDAARADALDYSEDHKPSHRLQFCVDEPLALEEASLSLTPAPLTQTPSTMYTHPAALRWPCLSPSLFVKDANVSASCLQGYADDSESCRHLQFCPDEPLVLEGADVFGSTPLTQTPTGMYAPPSTYKWPCLSPSRLVRDGCVGSIALSKVQNTFIHSPMPPPTPLRVGASRRSRSLPKDVGSDKDMWETTCRSLGCSRIPCVYQEHISSKATDQVHAFATSDSMPTPSVYSDYIPPSPALTASPMYGCGPLFASYIEPQSKLSHYVWPTPSLGPLNVISLASLLQ